MRPAAIACEEDLEGARIHLRRKTDPRLQAHVRRLGDVPAVFVAKGLLHPVPLDEGERPLGKPAIGTERGEKIVGRKES